MTEHDDEALSSTTRPRPASLPMEVLQNALDGVPPRRHPATYDPELDDAVHANLLAHTWYADTSQFYLLTRDVTDYELSFRRPEVKLYFGIGMPLIVDSAGQRARLRVLEDTATSWVHASLVREVKVDAQDAAKACAVISTRLNRYMVALAARTTSLELVLRPTDRESHCVYLIDPGCHAYDELEYAAAIVLRTLADGEFRTHSIWRQGLHICG